MLACTRHVSGHSKASLAILRLPSQPLPVNQLSVNVMDDFKWLKEGYSDQLESEYFLDGGMYRQQISDSHIAEIQCSKWRCLPPYLGMKTSDARDIDSGPGDEEEKMHTFFMKWKHTKGPAATHRQLTEALLRIHYGFQDAEKVCELIKLKKNEHRMLPCFAGIATGHKLGHAPCQLAKTLVLDTSVIVSHPCGQRPQVGCNRRVGGFCSAGAFATISPHFGM